MKVHLNFKLSLNLSPIKYLSLIGQLFHYYFCFCVKQTTTLDSYDLLNCHRRQKMLIY